jgi:hypothetical protein
VGYNPNVNGQNGQGQSSSVYMNSTGTTITAASALAQGTGNQVVLLDPANESTVFNIVGLNPSDIANGSLGQITSEGRMQNIPLSLGFSVGDSLFVSTTPGMLTNIKPTVGVNGFTVGDFIVFVGVVVQNQFNPSNQDIQILKQIVGQL